MPGQLLRRTVALECLATAVHGRFVPGDEESLEHRVCKRSRGAEIFRARVSDRGVDGRGIGGRGEIEVLEALANRPSIGSRPPCELGIIEIRDDRGNVLPDIADLLQVDVELGIHNGQVLGARC